MCHPEGGREAEAAEGDEAEGEGQGEGEGERWIYRCHSKNRSMCEKLRAHSSWMSPKPSRLRTTSPCSMLDDTRETPRKEDVVYSGSLHTP